MEHDYLDRVEGCGSEFADAVASNRQGQTGTPHPSAKLFILF